MCTEPRRRASARGTAPMGAMCAGESKEGAQGDHAQERIAERSGEVSVCPHRTPPDISIVSLGNSACQCMGNVQKHSGRGAHRPERETRPAPARDRECSARTTQHTAPGEGMCTLAAPQCTLAPKGYISQISAYDAASRDSRVPCVPFLRKNRHPSSAKKRWARRDMPRAPRLRYLELFASAACFSFWIASSSHTVASGGMGWIRERVRAQAE